MIKQIDSNEDVISIREIILKIFFLFRYLKRKWYWILSAIVIGIVGGYLYTRKEKTKFIATCSFVVEGQSSAQATGLAALLSGAVGNNGGGLFQGSTLLALYKTRLMLEKTLLTSADFNGKKELLIDRFFAINDRNQHWKDISNSEKNSVMKGVIGEISGEYLKITPGDMMYVEVKSNDELFSKAFVENIIETVNNYFIQTKTKKSLESIAILQRQADSLRRVLTTSMNITATAADANPNANAAMQVLKVPAQRKSIDVQYNTQLYSTISTTLETTKLELRKETPLIQIIDRPVLPLAKVVPNPKKAMLLFGLLGGILGSILIILNLFYKKIMSDDK